MSENLKKLNSEIPGDPYVYNAQRWLNSTYGDDSRYNVIPENGMTGWTTIYALTRALQIELGIQVTADNFGPTTIAKFNEQFPTGIHQQSDDDSSENNIYAIIQSALFCKGYATGVNTPTLHFYNGTGSAIKNLKEDAGLLDNTSTVTLNIMKALLSMDYFVCVYGGDETIRAMQQSLNRNYEDYIGLCPCDGVYSRNTNISLIYALQACEKMPLSVANGNFGPSTRSCCPTLPYDNVAKSYTNQIYSSSDIAKFEELLIYVLYVNGYGSGSTTAGVDYSIVKQFQEDLALPVTEKCDLTTWLSLLISCGDTERSVSACDCATILTHAKAQTLYNAGYRRVGRYLSGTIVGGASKALSKEEMQIAYDEGLYIFPIHQGSANYVEYFTVQHAIEDVASAVEHAKALGIPTGTVIYFAVDCDPQDWQITSYIIPYFEQINLTMSTSYNNKYKIGIYGTRNVCSRVSDEGYAVFSFVSNMSTGYSGNLGFKMPQNWAFDQFTTVTVGSGEGQIEIDKDAMSGRDLGIMSDLFLTEYGKFYYNLLDVYNLALDYTNNDELKSNMLVLQYLRKGTYGDNDIFGSYPSQSGLLNNIRWDVVAGEIDNLFCNLVDQKLGILDFSFVDNSNSINTEYDVPHWAATLNALLYQVGNEDLKSVDEVLDAYSGWAGDTLSFADNIQAAQTENKFAWASENICVNPNTFFDRADYLADLDAYNIYNLIQKGNTLPEAVEMYFLFPPLLGNKKEYEKRATNFINNMTSIKFNALCESINIDDFPINVLKEMITNAEQQYIDIAIQSFKNYVMSEYNNGR